MTIGFDLGHDLDLEFSRSNMEFPISQPKVVRLLRNEKQTYRLNSRPQMWPMVWIYQIVTGVTSVVGVPSTHLVLIMVILYQCAICFLINLIYIFYVILILHLTPILFCLCHKMTMLYFIATRVINRMETGLIFADIFKCIVVLKWKCLYFD